LKFYKDESDLVNWFNKAKKDGDWLTLFMSNDLYDYPKLIEKYADQFNVNFFFLTQNRIHLDVLEVLSPDLDDCFVNFLEFGTLIEKIHEPKKGGKKEEFKISYSFDNDVIDYSTISRITVEHEQVFDIKFRMKWVRKLNDRFEIEFYLHNI